MKIGFIRGAELVDLARTVQPGDELESPKDAPEELLQAYVNNGIAAIVGAGSKPALDATSDTGGRVTDHAPTESNPPFHKISMEVNDHVN